MAFSTPLALVLLICIPFVFYMGWPRQRYRRSRDIMSLILRTAIMLLLVFALAGMQLVRAADRLAVVFLVDVSDSVGQAAQETALDYVRQALPAMGPDDQAGVILFGANALVERPLSAVRELGTTLSAPPTGNTDLEEAVRLALGILPADYARRIVILSDGRETIGDVESAAELAAATSVEISYVLLTPQAAPEVQVTGVNAPSTLNSGQEFALNIRVAAEADTPASITVLKSGQLNHRENEELREGSNNYALALVAGNSGFTDFQVQVDPTTADNFYQNNLLSAFSRVVGPPRVLLLHTDNAEIRYLLPALEEAGLTVDAMQPEQLPLGLVALAQYDSVVMANVPATRLSPGRMDLLNNFVRDLGGGLIAIGGPNAYGPGGYFQTPLEDLLPLEMQVRDQQRLPQLTIAYIIDRSGSMGAVGPSGVENIELAKEAIIRSIDFLQPSDRAGVVSFDTQGYWIAGIQPVQDRLALQRLVASLRTGGGTDILAGMSLVAESIISDPSDRKHIILLTDGGANPSGLVALTRRLNEEAEVTTSVISIGGGPDFLRQMAEAGNGNYHEVNLVEQIPTIFTLETVLATRSYIFEESFVPSLSANSPIMDGIATAPPLLGYVATTSKQTAQVILRGPEPYRDPLLAAWQYGLGRSVAFTSDAAARWGANWVTWDDYVRFWSQAVRWTITEGTNNSIETRVVMEGENARLIVDARGEDGKFLNGLNLRLSVVDPQASPTLLNLLQVAPGRYEATFAPGQEGAYILNVRGEQGEQTLTQTTGWVMSYSSEYDIGGRGDGAALLNDIAGLTGGRSLADEPALAFDHTVDARAASTPVWPWLLLGAMLLLPFDVAVRRLIITRSDWQRLRRYLGGQRGAEATSERIATLLGAKERGRQMAEESGATAPGTVGNLRVRRDQARSASAAPTAGESGQAPEAEKPRYTPPPKPTQAPPSGNVAGELLKKRKGRDEEK